VILEFKFKKTMGQTASCCGNQDINSAEMETTNKGVNMLDLRKDGQEDKVVKIQAHARGFLTRKHINEQYAE